MATPKAQEFFHTAISPEEFALVMRKFLHATISMSLKDEDCHYQKEIKDGYCFLTQFCETLDPLLEKK